MGLGVRSTGKSAPGLKEKLGSGAGLEARRIWPEPTVVKTSSSLPPADAKLSSCTVPGLNEKEGSGAAAVGCLECLRA